MTEVLTTGNELVPVQSEIGNIGTTTIALPAIITSAGAAAVTRFVEYFTARIRNPHTRRSYFRSASDFLRWCEGRGIRDLKAIKPVIVAAYIEQLQQNYAKQSVKQKLTTIRKLFDWLVTGQIINMNPAHAVRGPKHIVQKGKTPVLTAEETRLLLDSIRVERVNGTDTKGNEIKGPDLIGLRDRAIIAAVVYTFAPVDAMVAMTVEDYYAQGKQSWFRLHEKGGKQHEMPANHTLEEYMDAYIRASGIADDSKGPLFRTAPRTAPRLTHNPMRTDDVWRMIRRRLCQTDLHIKAGCHISVWLRPPSHEAEDVRVSKRWPLELKRQIVKETLVPGVSVSFVARRHDVNPNQVFRWRHLYRRGELGEDTAESEAAPPPTSKPHSLPAPDKKASSEPYLTSVPAAVPETGRRAGMIEIALRGGIKVRVDATIDEAALRRLLAVVKEVE